MSQQLLYVDVPHMHLTNNAKLSPLFDPDSGHTTRVITSLLQLISEAKSIWSFVVYGVLLMIGWEEKLIMWRICCPCVPTHTVGVCQEQEIIKENSPLVESNECKWDTNLKLITLFVFWLQWLKFWRGCTHGQELVCLWMAAFYSPTCLFTKL